MAFDNQPLSEAWSDLRLSDAKFDSDFKKAQAHLVALTKQLEASAKIEVGATLDTTKTKAQIEAELRRLRAAGTSIVIPVSANVEEAQAAVAELATQVAAIDPELTIDANTALALARVEALKAQVDQLSAFETVIVQVEARTAQIREAQDALRRLSVLAATVDNDDIVIDAALRDRGVRSELALISALIETITGQPATIDVEMDAADVLAGLADIQVAVEALSLQEIELRLDTTPAEAALAGMRAGLSAFDQITLQLDIRTAQIDEARAALIRLATLAKSVEDDSIIIDADLRDAAVRSELGRLSALVASISGQTANIDIDLNAEEALQQMGAIQAAVVALDGRNIDLDLNVDSAGAVGEIAAVDQAARAASDPRTGGIGRLITMLGFIGVGGVVALGAAGGAITAFGVQASAALEGTVKSFENLLGSAEAADALFKELQAFAIPSPFETQTLADTTKSLLAIGVAAEDVVPVVKELGAIVALLGGGSNEAFGRLTLALGQIRSAVKPLTQDLRQITSAIPGFNTEMQLAQGVAEQFGISLAEAQEKIKDGSISGEEAFGIILQRMREFPGVAGAIEAAAGTLQGRLSAFTDTIKLNLVGAFSGVTQQITDLLDPLEGAVDRALQRIAPAIANSLETLIPNVPALVESLGTGLAPAFEGIFTGLGGVIQGLTPVIEKVLPLLGRIGPIVGQIASNLGPVVADVGENVGEVLVPALEALAAVLDIIPTGVLSTLLTGFLAFKAVRGIDGLFQSLSLNLQRLAAPRIGSDVNALSSALGRLAPAAQAAGITIGAAFAGIGLAAEDATTKALSAVTAIGTIVAGFSQGPIVGIATTAAVGVGALIGQFTAGKREAEEMERAVQSLADVLKREFPEDPNIQVPQLAGNQAFAEFVKEQLGDLDIEGELIDLNVGLGAVIGNLTKSREEFQKWIVDVANAALAADGLAARFEGDELVAFEPGTPGLIRSFPDEIEGPLNELITLFGLVGDAAAEANEDVTFENLGLPDAIDAANNFEARVIAAKDALAATRLEMEQINATGLRLSDLQNVESDFIDVNEAANLFEARVAGIPDTLDRLERRSQRLADNFIAEFEEAETAVRGVNDALGDLLGLLNSDIAAQNFTRDLQRFVDGVNQITNQDQIDEGLRIAEQIEQQRERIFDAQRSVIEAQNRADLDAASLQDEIENAERVGATNRAAELRRRLARLGEDTADERARLEEETARLVELENQLAELDLSPNVLIEQVRAQAQAAGLSLADFLRTGTSDEVIALNQQLVAPLVRSALQQIQDELEDEGPTAALALRDQLESDLLAVFGPTLGDATAQSIVDRFLPGDTWVATAQAAAREAREAAVAEFLSTGAIPLSMEIDEDTQNLLDSLTVLKSGDPIPVGVNIADLQAALAFVSELPATVQADLNFDEDAAETAIDDLIRRSRRAGGDSLPIPVELDPDVDAFTSEVEDVRPVVTVGLTADTGAVDSAITSLNGRQITLGINPDLDPEAFERLLRGIRPPTGTSLQFFRGGIFAMGSHYTTGEARMPFAGPMGPWARYGEPGTKGEAVFVPTHGDRDRTERLLRFVADRLGMDLTRRGPAQPTVQVNMPRQVSPPVQVSVPSASTQDIDVGKIVRDAVRAVLAEQRRPITQDDYDRAVSGPNYIDKLVLASPTAKKAAFEFIDEMRRLTL